MINDSPYYTPFVTDPLGAPDPNYWKDFWKRVLLETVPMESADPLSGLDIPLAPIQTTSSVAVLAPVATAVRTVVSGKVLLIAVFVILLLMGDA